MQSDRTFINLSKIKIKNLVNVLTKQRDWRYFKEIRKFKFKEFVF